MEHNEKNLICSMFNVPCSIKRGFTVIELLVGIVLFTLVVGAAVSVFLSVVSHQKKILSEEQLLNQISYAQERMSKALRMAKKDADGDYLDVGYIYQLTRPDISSWLYRGIKFINQSNNSAWQEFFLEDGILKEIADARVSSTAVPLTPDSLEIVAIRFGVNGADGCYGGETCPDGVSDDSDIQPRVTIVLSVRVADDPEEPIKTIQTTVSQRNLNTQ